MSTVRKTKTEMGSRCALESSAEPLLSRDKFKRLVFARSRGRCVFCGEPAVDAHHIMERKLFAETGGYFLSNGAAVCERHHWDCESTVLSVEAVRIAAGLTEPVSLPPSLDPSATYDKWGNLIWASGLRSWGLLDHDAGMRAALAKGKILGMMMPREYSEVVVVVPLTNTKELS